MKYLAILVFSALFLVSCGDREDPVVRFITPAQNTEVSPGETVPVQFEVTDNEALGSIDIGGDVSGVPTINVFNDLMKHSEIINLTVSSDTPSGSEITMNVKAKDQEGNEGSEDLVLKVK